MLVFWAIFEWVFIYMYSIQIFDFNCWENQTCLKCSLKNTLTLLKIIDVAFEFLKSKNSNNFLFVHEFP